jgi:uncharacterized membrane protein YccC
MINEEFQKIILDKLDNLEQEVKSVRTDLRQEIQFVKSDLREDIAKLDAKVELYGKNQQEDVYHLLNIMDKKLDQIAATQNIQSESINILAKRQFQSESEIGALKKAR